MTGATDVERVRVSGRELRETTWRAFRAVGASDGEASLAARSVSAAEIQLGVGLSAVPADLTPAAGSRRGCRVAPGIIDRLDDPAGRGLLLVAPLAAGLVATEPGGSPVRLPGIGFDLVVAGVLAQYRRPGGPNLLAFGVSEHGEPSRGVIVRPEGSVSVLEGDQLESWLTTNPPFRTVLSESPPTSGLVFSSDLTTLGVPADVPTTHPAAHHCRQPLREGVWVDASTWEPVHRAAHRFLVAER